MKKKNVFLRALLIYCLVLILITSVLNAFQTPIREFLTSNFGQATSDSIMRLFVY